MYNNITAAPHGASQELGVPRRGTAFRMAREIQGTSRESGRCGSPDHRWLSQQSCIAVKREENQNAQKVEDVCGSVYTCTIV